MGNSYVEGRPVKVHEVATSRLVGDDWERVRTRLAAAEGSAEDPGPPNFDCEDCAGAHVELLGPKEISAVLSPRRGAPQYGNYDEGDPWERLLKQLDAVRGWVEVWTGP